MEQQPASRSSENCVESEVDDYDFDDERNPGLPCTADGTILHDQAAAPGQAYVAPAPLRDHGHALLARNAVHVPPPTDELSRAILTLHHTQHDIMAQAVKKLAEFTTGRPPAAPKSSKQQMRPAGEARVAAFGQLSMLIMLLASDDKQVELAAAAVLDSLFLLTPEEQAEVAAKPDNIHQLVEALRSEDSVVQVAAAELLWMLTNSTPDSAASAAFPSVIGMIADILIDSNNIHLQSKGVQLVWAIAPHMYDRSRPADLAVVRSITSGVVNMLNHTEKAVQEQGAVHLAELGHCGGCLEPEVVPGVFAKLVGWLRSDDPNLQQLSLSAIKSLTHSSSQYRAAVAAVTGTLDVLTDWALQGVSTSQEVQVQAAELLAALMKAQADIAIREQVKSVPGVYKKLVRMLSDEWSDNIRILGAEMIASLVWHDFDVRTTFKNTDGCVPSLLAMLKSEDVGVHQKAALALAPLTLTSSNQIYLGSQLSYIPRLVQLLKHDNEDTQAHACLALYDLAAGCKPNRVIMRNLPGCLQVLTNLSRDQERRRVRLMAVQILKWFTGNREVLQKLVAGVLKYDDLKKALPPPAPTQQQELQEEDPIDDHNYGCYYFGRQGDEDDAPWWVSAWRALKARIRRRNQRFEPHRARGFAHRISSDIQAVLPGC